VLEELLAAEVLIIGVLTHRSTQHLVGQVVSVLEDASPAIKRVGSGAAGSFIVNLAEPPFRSPHPRAPSVTSGCFMSMI